ncbi:M28 family metallopeptidase [Gillisia hiemivivida]|uniref:M20/M25/M40 family metallo-hydrolase n=1 Tax=Gillisia hiemivivida TaxID=291190 RepID=A0A5C6ZY26_9FLAO|nr:M28 family metallopeptidase [Gillisia hiemivivida]TXD95825.1 M20/M25/M40 family metallo-hydrolase [Gillisia hiemivivida]
MKNIIPLLLLFLLFVGCNSNTKDMDTSTIQVDSMTIGNSIKILASDDFQGRKPFTEGEEKTTAYLKEQFSKLGLQPGNGDSYFQEVPMVAITGTPSEKMKISGNSKNIELQYFEDFVAVTRKTDSVVELNNSELVFAGYGIVAPEYGWNDYKGIDWKGKTAVVLVNDPGFESQDSTVFKGNTMTYYGRWTYKYEEAARQGAAGLLIIHDTKPASYGWNVVQSSWSGSKLSLLSDAPKIDVRGWITQEATEKIFKAAGMGDKNYKEMAMNKDFKPVSLGLNVSVSIQNKVKKDVSKNVVALLPGTNRKDEYIIYSAHWDHLGIGRPVDGDSIYNGAVDNASGIAAMLAIAEAFTKDKKPERSVVFLAVTAEEQGLLGSEYYASNPIYPPEKTVANINIDALSSPGPMKDLTVTGYGQSEMDEYAKDAADKQGRYIIPDPVPEKGYFFRSDHFSFAKIGIPALYASGAYEDFEHGKDFVKKRNEDYEQNKYHQPSDEYDADTFVLSGMQFDAQLLYTIGKRLSNEDYFPKWYDDSEFKAARQQGKN